MIKINGQSTGFSIGKYPDGTPAIRANFEALKTWYKRNKYLEIAWFYENMEELFILQVIVKYLREININNLVLILPYCPNARMDRSKSNEDVLEMKYFGQIINDMGFNVVKILDPHSTTVENVINNFCIIEPLPFIKKTLERIGNVDLLFYPDHGSESRYENIQKSINLPYLSGYKQRDWKTGKIESLQILGDTTLIKGKNILILDDICSKGGTFLYSAKALKEYGAATIYLYVTHCEDSIFQGEMINSGLIRQIYTTNSIYKDFHPLISVWDIRDM